MMLAHDCSPLLPSNGRKDSTLSNLTLDCPYNSTPLGVIAATLREVESRSGDDSGNVWRAFAAVLGVIAPPRAFAALGENILPSLAKQSALEACGRA